MVKYEGPWPHLVIDNYFEPDAFEVIERRTRNYIGKRIDQFTRKRNFENPSDIELRQAMATRPLTKSMLEHFPNRRDFDELSLYWEVNFLKGPYSYPIHDEAPRKVLSCVVYVGPEENAGTALYNPDKTFAKRIDWKPNRALIFAGIDGVTWHNYTCPAKSFRLTINQFLERPNEQIS